MSTSLMTAFTSCRDAVVALRWYRVFFVRRAMMLAMVVCYLIQCLRSYFICQRPHHGTSSSLRPEAPCPQNQLDYTTFFSDLHPLFAFFPPVWYNG